jgi:nitrite reductase/ring-hydroxylating ferredoxin subunit
LTDKPKSRSDRGTRLCSLEELPPNAGRSFEIEEERVVVFLVGGAPRAFVDSCPHFVGASIEAGFVEEGAVACPNHGWRFDLETGANLDGEGGGLTPVETRVEEGDLFVRTPRAPRWKLW